MHIYLDSRDLIAITDKYSDEEISHLHEGLSRSKSNLVYSMHNIIECCAPLVHGGPSSNVMQRLNQLEDLPHVYIVETLIETLELKEAVSAFLEDRNYQSIELPIVPRFDYVVSAFNEVPTKEYLNYGLAHNSLRVMDK